MERAIAMLWVVPLVTFLGYASHRASLCTVRAVADVMQARRFGQFGGFARAVLWAMLVTIPAILFFPERFAAPAREGPLWFSLFGGLSFGFGAALNKGCSFSTLQRLADADWRMLFTFAGFLGGTFLWYLLSSSNLRSTFGVPPTEWLRAAMVVLPFWAVMELTLLWRRYVSLHALIHAQHYSPAAIGLLLGVGSGILYLGFGPWTYTNSLQSSVGALMGKRGFPPVFQLALVPALFAGMLVSAWQRGAWQVRKCVRGWGVHLLGGIFMGLGAALIPGGNDTLLLRLIPLMVPNSLWSYLMLILGVVIGLLLNRSIDRILRRQVDCGGATRL